MSLDFVTTMTIGINYLLERHKIFIDWLLYTLHHVHDSTMNMYVCMYVQCKQSQS